MLEIPFPLRTFPSDGAVLALEALRRERPGVVPVLLGDADIFSAEWAEVVDEFQDPEGILAEARRLDIDAWFSGRSTGVSEAEARMDRSVKGFNLVYRVVTFPLDAALFPIRLGVWAATRRRPRFLSRSPFDAGTGETDVGATGLESLKAQLAELEAAGAGSEADLAEIREVIAAMEAEGAAPIFPDPVDYVTPRSGGEVAAGLIIGAEPWEGTAWLQHGTYAMCAPKPVFVAHCRWMWQRFGAAPITASTDHVGFELSRPIGSAEEAQEVLRRFTLLGATEINADHAGSGGDSLVGAPRLWVWWD